MKKKIHLAFDLSWTTVETHWRLPGSWVDRHHPNIGMFQELARTAERGGFDMLFFGDGTGMPDTWRGSTDAAVEWRGVAAARHEPVHRRDGAVTEHIGFGLTYASTFMHPFYVARLLNSLDHVTGGRIAFNVVASQRGADSANYGFDELIEHNERYERMDEFIDVCRALWTASTPTRSSWTAKRAVADPRKVAPIDHVGEFFKVQGAAQRRAHPAGSPGA